MNKTSTKFILGFFSIFLLLAISGCSEKAPAYTAQELAQLYTEKPEEAAKLEGKEVVITGRVLWKSHLEDKSITLTLWQEGNYTTGRTIYQFNLPATEENNISKIKINDVVEAKGTIQPLKEVSGNGKARMIKVSALSKEPTNKKEIQEITTVGALDLVNKYNKNRSEFDALESHTIKLTGKVLQKNQFSNSTDFFIALAYDYETSTSLLVHVPNKEKDKLNQIKDGDFVDFYGILLAPVAQEAKNTVSIQVIIDELP